MVDKQCRGNENKEKSRNVFYIEHLLAVGNLQ